MKAYSIGREAGCDIVINDTTDVISRRHAILNVAPSGKMTIVDQSHNGTYVNGIRISPNVPVPVTRKDTISFAHVAKLDWNRVPKTTSMTTYIVIAVLAIIVVVGAIFGIKALTDKKDNPSQHIEQKVDQPADSIKDKPKEIKTETTEKTDTVGKAEKKAEKKEKTTTKKETKEAKKELCPTCKKPVSECEYKGEHPEKTAPTVHKR